MAHLRILMMVFALEILNVLYHFCFPSKSFFYSWNVGEYPMTQIIEVIITFIFVAKFLAIDLGN